jgi:tetratricopeptide (TPR) repeat protein
MVEFLSRTCYGRRHKEMQNVSTKDRPRRDWSFLPVVVGLAVLLGTGCGQSGGLADADPGRSPYFQKAKKSYEARDYPAAAGFYQQALQVDPQLARAHLELGLLYDEKLGDPIGAIYHYRQFLELEPKSDKRQLVEDFIERAKLSLASKLPQSPAIDPGDLVRLQNEKAALMQENANLRAHVAELEKAPATTTTPSPPPPGPAPAAAIAVPSTSVSASEMSTEIYKPHTHVVQKGDTLQSLALKYYGTRSAWDKIYQINRTVLASKDQLKIGQQLVIP